MNGLLDIKKIVEGAGRIGITGHERPDGDCIGATLGLYNYLKKICPKGTVIDIFLETLGPKYSYLKSFDEISFEFGPQERYDVFFTLDCSTIDRFPKAGEYFEKAGKTVCIDHHVSNDGFGTECYVDGDASSASELVCRLIPKEEMDEDIAICLYSGIISDSGVLQYSCTSPETLRTVADLISFGFDFTAIIDRSYYEKTYVQNQLLGRALVESVRFLDGRAIFTCVSKSMMDFYEATPKDLDGIVNQLLLTKGVKCAVFMYESDNMQYKVSLRGDNDVNVAKIAVMFGGGGHVKAAGCTMSGTMYDVINNISEQIEKQL